MLTIEYAKNPKWVDASHTVLDVVVKFSEFAEEVPFTASEAESTGSVKHAADIWNNCIAGVYGEIEQEDPPYEPTDEELAFGIRQERDNLLQASDWTQLPDVPQETKDLWAAYRQALRDITSQAGFPREVIWPVKP